MKMTNDDLTKANYERKRRGLPTLTRMEAEAALRRAPLEDRRRSQVDEGFDTTGFVLGYLTGLPISPLRGISAESFAGSMLHNMSSPLQDDTRSSIDTSSPSDTSSSNDTSSSSDTGGGGGDP